MRIAIPITNGKLSAHFGHCEQFAIIDVDDQTKQITAQEMLTPPAHEPGVLPKWLGEMNVQIIIAGGMGQRAQQLFTQNQIQVLCGAPDTEPKELVSQYMDKTLELGQNICDH
ncbi:MAG: NifB/NifX family molybdenum-iron cluster-binding protein [Sedimentisphaerales bacterium]|nr:NifB/NifX family molybdenum-iron cluster-binding protein [Sedimentisphaerales bacterium]